MKIKKLQQGLTVLFAVVLLIQMFPLLTFAEPLVQTYEYDTFIRTKEDKGYSGEEPVKENDKHYGWKLGKFIVEGYTSSSNKDEKGNMVFLKNVGDTVTLSFRLDQEISMLNGDKKLTIGRDKKGYDQYFQEKKQDFGLGALIVKHTDHRNSSVGPIVYSNYLSGLTVGANTQIKLCEEGDYEVALNYKVKKAHISIAGHNTAPTETDYRIFFKFSVRNGNCMVFLNDVKTNSELSNSSMTENGFRLDLKKSHYLDINIKKEILTDSADGLIEDTRFNKSANDDDEYTDEGIYIITVTNRYTSVQTVKKIYVGKNSLLKAFFTTGLSVSEINNLVAKGATINDDGTIVFPVGVTITDSESSDHSNAIENTELKKELNDKKTTISKIKIVWIAIIAIIVILVVILVLLKKHRPYEKASNNVQYRDDDATSDDVTAVDDVADATDDEGEDE